MSRLRDDYEDRQEKQDGPPNAVDLIVIQLLVPWTRKNGRLPQPCPMGLRECAEWWLNVMQEPEIPGETYQCACVSVTGKLRCETGYANRCRSALLGFLNISETRQRDAVVTMVTEDKIPYRGESIRQYYDIAEETLTMRNDPEHYKRNAVARLKSAFARMSAQPCR